MTSTVMFMSAKNETGAVLTNASIVQGQDYAIKVVQKTLSAIDIGNAAGKTEHAEGALCFTPSGCSVKAILSCSAFVGGSGNMKVAANAVARLRGDGSIAVVDSAAGAEALIDGDVINITFITGPA